jgi:hypothetical protein
MSRIERHIRQDKRKLLGVAVKAFTARVDQQQALVKRNRILKERRHVIDAIQFEQQCTCDICKDWIGKVWLTVNELLSDDGHSSEQDTWTLP